MPLEFRITKKDDERLPAQAKKVEIPASGGSQDILDFNMNFGHVLYPGDFESDHGGKTYVRTEAPAAFHELELKPEDTKDIEIWLPTETDGQNVQLSDEYVLRLRRKK